MGAIVAMPALTVVPNTAAKNSRFSSTLRSGYSEKRPGM